MLKARVTKVNSRFKNVEPEIKRAQNSFFPCLLHSAVSRVFSQYAPRLISLCLLSEVFNPMVPVPSLPAYLPKWSHIPPWLQPHICLIPKLVCSGYYNKVPQTVWLKQQSFIFLQLWRLEIWEKTLAGLSPWLLGGCLLPMSSHGLPSLSPNFLFL